ncbi:unnamed protein product [Ceratitis capitata]|uniref:(Mediterranean fruit fly) hypothetical protein n=1 Tax=Ceratitis capitata TaxID=7213 RepID=A0A811VBP8_CERCA|nr:unnamed protein product [Ceratitis capitata]
MAATTFIAAAHSTAAGDMKPTTKAATAVIAAAITITLSLLNSSDKNCTCSSSTLGDCCKFTDGCNDTLRGDRVVGSGGIGVSCCSVAGRSVWLPQAMYAANLHFKVVTTIILSSYASATTATTTAKTTNEKQKKSNK